MDEDLKEVSYNVYEDDKIIASNKIPIALMLMVTDTFHIQKKNTNYSVEFNTENDVFRIFLENHEL
jgi:K+-transporting ATPase A subunit